MTPDRPIGVFDSGVGGLSVLREIRRELPHEDLLYVADSGYAPYGDQSTEAIESRAIAVTELLLAQGAKAIVVACNTATGAAARVLRSRYPVPVIAMEPAVKPALRQTRSGIVGVLATRQTLASPPFSRLLAQLQLQGGAEILLQPCPGLVEQVEAGDLDGDATRTLLASYIEPLLAQGADTLVLGCTHYPHLSALIGALAGPETAVLDSGEAVARQVRRRLAEAGLLAPPGRAGSERFWTTGHPARVRTVMERLWGDRVELHTVTHQEASLFPLDAAASVAQGV
jgi:glutamate racemase